MSKPMNHLELAQEVDMQPALSPPLMADFNIVHKQGTWLTKVLEALRDENKWIQIQL